MNSILVDTGAWYAYLDEDDPDHHSVRRSGVLSKSTE